MGEAESKGNKPNIEKINPLLAPLQSLQGLLSRINNKGVIIGGVAVSLMGVPRYTVDLDAVILLDLDDIPSLLLDAAKEGIEPRISDPINFARRYRVLLMRHVPSGVDIDISLGVLPFEIEMVERSRIIDIGSIILRLPTPEDLIIMKAVAHRSKDLEDIHAIAASHPELDKARIRFWVDQFAEALEMPELWIEISNLL